MIRAAEYHERTKHAPGDFEDVDFGYEYGTLPRPFKTYRDLPRVALSGVQAPVAPALSVVAESGRDPLAGTEQSLRDDVNAETVASLCYYAAGVKSDHPHSADEVDWPQYYRIASCTGNLHHVDAYAVCADLDGLDAGVYHFDPKTFSLDLLREGDYRGTLAEATGDGPATTGDSAEETAIADAPVIIALTSEWWRNAWKYRGRTYRHAFWDSGTILANLLATAHAGGHRAEVVTGFADAPVVELLGLDPDAEAPLELVPVSSGDPAPAPPPVDAIDSEETPLSPEQDEYPLVPDAWHQSTLADGDAATEWRRRARGADPAAVGRRPPGDGDRIDLDPVDADTASARPVGGTIARRGSLREYSHDPISDRTFATVLDRALRGVPTDGASDAPGRLLDCYCLVHAVDGVPEGAYQYHPDETALERVGPTDRETAGHLALDQPVVGDAAVNVYLVADVDAVVQRLGDRGYRLAQLEAGIALGRLYLATYAHLALGGRGFTFYDDLVTEHLGPRADGQSPMTLFAFGRPA